MLDDKETFETWWNSAESPARHMTTTAAYFAKPFMLAAFNAGKKNWKPRKQKEIVERFSL